MKTKKELNTFVDSYKNGYNDAKADMKKLIDEIKGTHGICILLEELKKRING